MTKARDLSNLISTGVPNSLITLDANEIPNIDAGKITSGTFADARIASSNVSQHATSFDDNKIVNDISTLAIRQASNENKGAYNTNSMYVDVFQDDSGIGTETNTDRNASEYVSSGLPAGFATNNTALSTSLKQLYNFDNSVADSLGNQNLINNGNAVTFNSSYKKLGTHSAYFDGGATTEFSFDNGSGSKAAPYHFTNNSNGSFPPAALTVAYWAYWTPNNSNWNMVYDGYHPTIDARRNFIFGIGSDEASYTDAHDKPQTWDGADKNWGNAADGGSQTQASAVAHNTWIHIIHTLTSSRKQIFVNGTRVSNQTGTFGFESDGNGQHICIGGRDSSSIYQYRGYLDQFALWDKEFSTTDASYLYNSGNGNVYLTSSLSATGNFISNVITAPSSTSKMGAIITYQDQAGTNTLNTDIVLQLSADNGSNFATATMTALPDFATGIKMAKVNDLSVTAGTQLKYKISFANQSGSKEARIRGVSLQY